MSLSMSIISASRMSRLLKFNSWSQSSPPAPCCAINWDASQIESGFYQPLAGVHSRKLKLCCFVKKKDDG